jgi:hypothetical protein
MQRLPPKPQGVDAPEILRIQKLAGAVGTGGLTQIHHRQTAAVVRHLHLPGIGLNRYGDPRCPRIQGIFRQLPHHRRRGINHLPCGHQLHHILGKPLNGHGYALVTPCLPQGISGGMGEWVRGCDGCEGGWV